MIKTHSDEYLDKAQDLAAKVAERVDEIDAERQISTDLFHEMADAGFFRLLVPRSLGGAELAPLVFFEIVRIFAEVDASTAWCMNQNNIFATDAARMPYQTAHKLWDDRYCVVTNGPPSEGSKAIPTEGGYRLSGHWDFSSGSSYSTWLAARSPVEGESGPNRMFLIPKTDATMLDTWAVNGLRGTASFSFELDDVFVPESYTYLESQTPHDDGVIFIIPKIPLFAIGFGTISIALARACLDDAIKLALRKSQRDVADAMVNRSTVHREIGEAEATLRAADTYLRTSAMDLWDSVCKRKKVDVGERIDVRMASTHAIRQASEVVDVAYEMFGSDAIFKSNLLQRRYQDMHVIVQQIQGRATNFETAGRYFLGLDLGRVL
ncbi:MAG: acyl-CoA dehydrogenase family protein [Chloroflexota bacterium]|nr:acyl-CoA dehydrogenase family protein [Chloroflexota bacterium]|tara:strand:- start:1300 stop:2436 length:1137 start_codon:yes stop_codon:yes gene_type:complete